MTRHRVLLSLALMGLLGLVGNQAQAGPITLIVDLNGAPIYTAPLTGTNTISANLGVLNTILATDGSAYKFSSLSANSNFPGGSTGYLQTTGQVSTSNTGVNTGNLSVDTTQAGFTSPTGSSGTLTSTSVVNYVNVATGGISNYTSDFQSVLYPPINSSSTGLTTNGTSNTITATIAPVPTGYTLSNHYLINLTRAANLSDGFTGTVQVTAVPEPSSIVMLLTGMPLPLAAVFALIRFRRAGA